MVLAGLLGVPAFDYNVSQNHLVKALSFSKLEGIARDWNPYQYASRFVNSFTHYDPSPATPDRSSFAPDARNIPSDQLEDYLKVTGNSAFPLDSEYIPHFEMSTRPKNTIRQAKARAANARQKQIMQAKANKKPVVMSAPGYPSVRQSLETSSLLVSAPTQRTKIQRSGQPRVAYRPNGDCSIRHRELIADVNGSVAFATTKIPVNPGLNGSFPWLSRIANNYESYVLNSLRYCFETSAATTFTGQVMLTVDYDASDSAPTTKIQASSYRGTVACSPWCPSCHTSLRSDLQKRKTYYMRAGNIPAGEDIALYDVGNMFVCTYGQASTALAGELWVEYDVRLLTPKTLSSGSGNSIWGSYSGSSNAITGTGSLSYDNGNLPIASLILAGGTPTLFATWTFAQDWQGVVSWQITGTGVGTLLTGFGSATLTTLHSTLNGAATSETAYQTINALAGQTYSTQIPNTTISFIEVYFTQGTGAFN